MIVSNCSSEWGSKYEFYSCADVNIMPPNTFTQTCSGHGRSFGGRCRCDRNYYGDVCQYQVLTKLIVPDIIVLISMMIFLIIFHLPIIHLPLRTNVRRTRTVEATGGAGTSPQPHIQGFLLVLCLSSCTLPPQEAVLLRGWILRCRLRPEGPQQGEAAAGGTLHTETAQSASHTLLEDPQGGSAGSQKIISHRLLPSVLLLLM